LARPPAEIDPGEAFVREVDEEYRREKLASFWSRYGRWLLIALGLFLVALAGFLYWRQEQQRAAGEFGAEFMQAVDRLDGGNLAAAKPTLAEAATADQAGYEALGRLAQAAVAAREGKAKEAAAMYAAIAADGDVADPFRQLATIKQTMLQFDELPTAQIAARLQPLTNPGSPWLGTAGELLGAAYMREGKPELAAPLFQRIARDEAAPPSIRARATQMASMLGADATPQAPAGTATPAAPAKAD
jgi:hypothetical protein